MARLTVCWYFILNWCSGRHWSLALPSGAKAHKSLVVVGVLSQLRSVSIVPAHSKPDCMFPFLWALFNRCWDSLRVSCIQRQLFQGPTMWSARLVLLPNSWERRKYLSKAPLMLETPPIMSNPPSERAGTRRTISAVISLSLKLLPAHTVQGGTRWAFLQLDPLSFCTPSGSQPVSLSLSSLLVFVFGQRDLCAWSWSNLSEFFEWICLHVHTVTVCSQRDLIL